MSQVDEYKKTCPKCGDEFIAKHLSSKYCCETCKRRMFREKKQQERKKKVEDQKTLDSNDFRLGILHAKGKPSYSRMDLEDVKFNFNCYYKKFKIENFIISIMKDYSLLEFPNRVYKISKACKKCIIKKKITIIIPH